jgi:hypothetical protein
LEELGHEGEHKGQRLIAHPVNENSCSHFLVLYHLARNLEKHAGVEHLVSIVGDDFASSRFNPIDGRVPGKLAEVEIRILRNYRDSLKGVFKLQVFADTLVLRPIRLLTFGAAIGVGIGIGLAATALD